VILPAHDISRIKRRRPEADEPSAISCAGRVTVINMPRKQKNEAGLTEKPENAKWRSL